MYGFTREQLGLICEALKEGGLTVVDERATRRDLLQEIYDAIKLDSLERKWKVERKELERNLEALTNPQAGRLIAGIARFWSIPAQRTIEAAGLLGPTAWLLNSAVMAAGAYGIYEYTSATAQDLRTFIRDKDPVSRIGFEDTCDYIYSLTRYRPPVSRAISTMAVGEEAMVVRLRYRVDPDKKGKVSPPRDSSQWEIARLRRLGKEAA
jgi:hypothetical protein